MEPDLEKEHGLPLPLSGSMIFFGGGYGAVMGSDGTTMGLGGHFGLRGRLSLCALF